MDSTTVAADVATATRVLAHAGLIAPFGHVSSRVPGTDYICILADSHSRGKNKMVDTTADDTVLIDMDGEVVEGRHTPPGERFIHTEMYRARSDVNSVVHAHPFYSVALTAAGKTVLPVWTTGSVFVEGVPTYERPVQIETPALGREVAATLGEARAALLRGHGCVVVGDSVKQATVDTVKLEKTAHLQTVAAALGPLQPLERAQFTDELLTPGLTAAGHYAARWDHLVRSLPEVAPGNP